MAIDWFIVLYCIGAAAWIAFVMLPAFRQWLTNPDSADDDHLPGDW